MMGKFMHAGIVLLTTASLVVSPALAQAQEGQAPPSATAQAPPQPAQATGVETRDLKATEAPDYSNGPHAFPNFISPYAPIHIQEPMLTNTPRIDQLIQNGKLMLSLEDAISIALENNLDISVQRFTPWIAETQLLKAKAGGIPQSGSAQQVVLGSGPSVPFDPIITSNLNWARSATPVNNPLLSGTGTTSVLEVTNYSANANFGYSQGFHTGTSVSLAWSNNRASTNSGEAVFNPAVQSTLTFTISQPLLNGFGILPNTRFIIEAKNSLKVANSVFAQQVISTVAAVSFDYWELVYARENVKVEEAAVGVSTKLYEDNKKQLEIGTMAPLDVLTAESQLATDTQNLIVAQTNQLQQETILLVAITKNPLAVNLTGVEIVPTTPITIPDVEPLSLESAVKQAWEKRPELQQASLNLKNAEIEVKATNNSLLPALNLFGQYSATGLNGNLISMTPTGAFTADALAPVVNAAGTPVAPPIFVGSPVIASSVKPGGLGEALSDMINAKFPTYAVGLNLTLPVRNRSAQADSARALLDQRQLEVQYRSTQNQIVLAVRNALIALQQDKAQVAAAGKARELAQQTLNAEQKKYQLGSSTSYNVVLRARDLTAALGTELRAKANLVEAVVNLDQAMGRTLETNHIIVADSLRGTFTHEPNIPGTPNWDVSAGK